MSVADIKIEDYRRSQAGADSRFLARWSPRAMSGQALTEEQMQVLVEASRWSPSCFNSQPWRFVYSLRDDSHWDKFLGLLMDMNRAWANKAGALVVILSKNNFDDSCASSPTSAFDTGSAWMSMALQANSLGLVAHAMWGIHHDLVPEAINLTEEVTVRGMAAIGYPGEVDGLPENYREKEVPSQRKPLESLMFRGNFGE